MTRDLVLHLRNGKEHATAPTSLATISNYAPWLLTVAANIIDRKFVAEAVLGNGIVLNGLSINDFNLSGNSHPLIWVVAAYVKAKYPNWSPAAIKSTLMTRATVMDWRGQDDLEFAYGSGQLNPEQGTPTWTCL
ncbi:hypothetical protein SLEP1_g8738 [Rubroshorea leprosula]|uniref:Uncharacterized protein n=1 Tax=Rubroshorea leprosula TaxID=152421 RepID=A0AAV5IB15_9ROSI|nr:hypothetical protein SLEP1_g8738 [Rubroshorea leprosula]